MNFFSKSTSSSQKYKNPADLVKIFVDNATKLDSLSTTAFSDGTPASQDVRKYTEEVTKTLRGMKSLLSSPDGGSNNADPQIDQATELSHLIFQSGLLKLLLKTMPRVDFEARKDGSNVFGLLLRRQVGSRCPGVDYVCREKELVGMALRGYESEEVALNTGQILKEMLRHEALARILLYSDDFYLFMDYIEKTLFATSCDAFANMKECLTRHKQMVSGYLEANYDKFFTAYKALILSPNYVTKRQSLKLLGEILLDRSNYSIMTRYIASVENLQLIMNTLRDKSKNIQFEAFHVFKIFVANPHKPPAVASILRKNKDRLLAYLTEFHKDRDVETL
ncbi:hypothetical protein QFC24_005826 [Naganishia onofrii]|uniref:Uncharacterized protein n=1 Tax=Naganishia onofrii TaxID=1851511 RepID=A0ACC2X7I8_9TREE|nr:hypothetical protein QFC24_005826 [Naganishia onofrii]